MKDNNKLFEALSLSGQESGLNWYTILLKREQYRSHFHHFDIEVVAGMDESDVDVIVGAGDVVSNKKKIRSIIHNAKLIKAKKDENPDFTLQNYLYSFINNQPILNYWKTFKYLPAETPESEAMSIIMKEDGFEYVGATIIYAFMQSVGMVMDHPMVSPQRLELVQDLERLEGGYQNREFSHVDKWHKSHVGNPVRSYDPDKEEWINGEVVSFSRGGQKKKLWHIQYDDGDEEDLNELTLMRVLMHYRRHAML